ncbi:MAG: sigma-70 family RNA polymerase sigma factor [Planctomycetales bacterium]|nr:sigma-70 family RNA polymerase sigma factor [Planctomycetales bacterium]
MAYRMTGNTTEAADLSQEIFLRAFQNLRRYDPTRPFAPWLYRLGRNLSVNWVTRRPPLAASLDRRTDEGALLLDPPAPGREAPEAAARAEEAGRVRAAILRLPPPYRAILTLHYFQGLAYEDLVETLELPLGTVKNRLFRAREALREVLEAEGLGGRGA